MCGITGYIGKRKASQVVIDGLCMLEYRGYDSAGIGLFDENGKMQVIKKAGFVSGLKKLAYDR